MKYQILVFTIITLLFSETVRVGGFVTGPDGVPLENALVSLTNKNVGTRTDAEGYFMIDGSTSITNVSTPLSHPSVTISSSALNLSLVESQSVDLSIIRLNGQTIPLFSGDLTAGTHSIAFQENLGTGVYLLRAKIGTTVSTMKFMSGTSTAISPKMISIATGTTGAPETMRSTRAVDIDTLVVSHDGYRTRSTPLTSYITMIHPIILGKLGKLWDPSELENNDTLITGSRWGYIWTDIIWKNSDLMDTLTSVIIDSVATEAMYDGVVGTNGGVVAQLIRQENNSTLSTKTSGVAIQFENPRAKTIHDKMFVTYKVESADDTLALHLTKTRNHSLFDINFTDSTDGILRHYSSFRAVLTTGANNPGVMVTDTLTLNDFSLKYGQDDRELMNILGYTVHADGEVYLDENRAVEEVHIEGMPYEEFSQWIVFEAESEGMAGDTLNLTVEDFSYLYLGNFNEDFVNGLELIETNGWFPIHDGSSTVNTEWVNGTTKITLERGASNENEKQWAYSGVVSVLNDKGNLTNLDFLDITFIAPQKGDTIALSIERGERLGAGAEDANRYGSFRVIIPWERDSLNMHSSDTLVPGAVTTISFNPSDFSMNWSDDPSYPYQKDDRMTPDFLLEANAIGIFSERDIGIGGSAEKGDSLTFEILDLSFRGSHGLQTDILPLIGQ